MRVTNYSILQRWLDTNQTRLSEMDTSNRQIATGKKVEKPSDDPNGAKRVIQLEELVKRNEKYLSNISEAINMNATTESIMDAVFARLMRVKEVAIESSSQASVAEKGVDSANIEELKGLKEQLVELALTKVEGKYAFNGTTGDAPPYAKSLGGDYLGNSDLVRINLGQGQTVPLNLTGDRAFRETEIRSRIKIFADSAATLPINPAAPITFTVSDGLGVDTNITVSNVDQATLASQINAAFAASGANLSASIIDGRLSMKIVNSELGGEPKIADATGDLDGVLGMSEGTKNIFGVLDDLIATMESGTLVKVSTLLDRLDRLSDNVANQRGQYGSRARNLSFARERIEQNNITSADLRDQIESADITRAVTKLNSSEQAYQASLAAGSRLFNISILNYLR